MILLFKIRFYYFKKCEHDCITQDTQTHTQTYRADSSHHSVDVLSVSTTVCQSLTHEEVKFGVVWV